MIITLVGNCCHRVMSCLIHRQEWKRTLDCRLISLIWFLRHSERVNDSHFEYSEKEKERERELQGGPVSLNWKRNGGKDPKR